MDTETKRILAEAMGLPANERADLAVELLSSLDRTRDEDADSYWKEEVARRLQELDGGTVATISWLEARRMILGGENGASPR